MGKLICRLTDHGSHNAREIYHRHKSAANHESEGRRFISLDICVMISVPVTFHETDMNNQWTDRISTVICTFLKVVLKIISC